MAEPLKVIGTEITLTTANTVGLASLVRLVNVDPTNAATVTIKTGAGGTLGTFTLGSSGTDFSNECIVKSPTDTLESTGATSVKATSIAYR
jgi:hypothetical protein